jgi:rhodanese-related sulfurtransferase
MQEMDQTRSADHVPGHHGRLAWALAVIGFCLPLFFGWLLVGRSPSLSPAEVRRQMTEGKVRLVAVDAAVRATLPGIGLWPTRDILAIRELKDLPEDIRNENLVLVCLGGVQSSVAARHLEQLGFNSVHSVQGGIQALIAEGNDETFFRSSPLVEQWVAILSFFGVKLLYSLLSAGLIFLLWDELAPDLAALRRSMEAFFVGEAFCFVNVMFFGDLSVLLEYLHSAGMVISLALLVYAVLEGLDTRLIHFTGDNRCAFTSPCKACFKYGDVPCGLRRVFLVALPACIVSASLPLLAPFQNAAYTTKILGLHHGYRHPVLEQVYELRFLPWAAILLFAACLLVLLGVERRKVPLSKVLFSAAAGAVLFSFFRMILVAIFAQNLVWFAAWEELSELIFVAMACCVVIVFRRGMLTSERSARFLPVRSEA